MQRVLLAAALAALVFGGAPASAQTAESHYDHLVRII